MCARAAFFEDADLRVSAMARQAGCRASGLTSARPRLGDDDRMDHRRGIEDGEMRREIAPLFGWLTSPIERRATMNERIDREAVGWRMHRCGAWLR